MPILAALSLFIGAVLALAFMASSLVVHGVTVLICALLISGTIIPLVSQSVALWLFLAILPIFGNRPGSSQAYYLLLLSSTLQIGLLLSLVRAKFRCTRPWLVGQNSLWLLTLLWLLMSSLSLTSLPLGDLYLNLKSSIPKLTDLSALLWRVHAFATSTEEKLDYSPLSVVLTLYSINIALWLYGSAKESHRLALIYASAVLFGLVLALGSGLCDYYQLIDLRVLRALDPVVNPGDVQFRLQSFFGHSGWFAEYVTLCIPFAMLLLRIPLKFMWRLMILLALLLTGELTLILTFQRGGWLSYPLTLFVVWAAIYITYRLERGETDVAAALKRSLVKVAVCLPLTICASLLVLWSLGHYGWLGPGRSLSIPQYSQRFKDIQRTSDRTDFMRAGFLIGSLYPFLGAGSESFAYQYRREFKSVQGHFPERINLPLHGSAHNVYFQTFAGKGMAGLAVLLTLLGLLLYRSLKLTLGDKTLLFDSKLMLMVSLCFGMAFLIYGNVQEVFYIQSLQFLFFAVIGLAAASTPSRWDIAPNSRRLLCTALGMLTLCHLVWLFTRFDWPGWFPNPNTDYGCYGAENDQHGGSFKWCGVRARQPFIVQSQLVSPQGNPTGYNAFVHFQVQMGMSQLGPQGATLRVGYQGRTLHEELISPEGTYDIKVPLPETLPDTLRIAGSTINLDLSSASYFIPARDTKSSQDMRALSFKLY